MTNTIAALFVEENGCYYGIDGVDPWGVTRDARRYDGPYPIVAHPPCKRWGKFWRGSIRKNAKREKMGDDGGCFEVALRCVRQYGGVIEHPAGSHAWNWFGITQPESHGGWSISDSYGGFSCCVSQGWYGHDAPKKTWLYACKTDLPALRWGTVKTDGAISHVRTQLAQNCDTLFPDEEMGKAQWNCMPYQKRTATPTPFRDLLISIARSAYEFQPSQALRTLFAMPEPVPLQNPLGTVVDLDVNVDSS